MRLGKQEQGNTDAYLLVHPYTAWAVRTEILQGERSKNMISPIAPHAGGRLNAADMTKSLVGPRQSNSGFHRAALDRCSLLHRGIDLQRAASPPPWLAGWWWWSMPLQRGLVPLA